VVANLLGNARTHTPPGTRVTVRLRGGHDGVRLEVADDGPGIPAELLPHVTERFARGDAGRARTTGSTGLGLAIVAAVVAEHGGRLEIASVPGDTRVTVAVPAAPVAPVAPAVRLSSGP
jgi:two-component system, OmpR family, sensor kinase